MNVDSHKRTLAIIHLVVGIFKLLIFGGISIAFSIFLPFIENQVLQEEGTHNMWVFDLISGAFISIMIVIALFTAVPSIIGGFATLKGKKYGMTLLLIAGCVSLLSFPIGTAIGAYTIWVYIENGKGEKNEIKE